MRRQLNILEDDNPRNTARSISHIIASYESIIVKLYCTVRFRIIPLRFLAEIAQYIPATGCVLDLGCGFGLFTLYFAQRYPATKFLGIDWSRERIRAAELSASRLGLTNASFICQDARIFRSAASPFNIVMTLDLLHHLPVQDGNALVAAIYDKLLASEGLFIMKDVTTRPRAMLYFTFILDWLMGPNESFFYRSAETWVNLLRITGFASVQTHYLWDVLPYPHILLVSRKP